MPPVLLLKHMFAHHDLILHSSIGVTRFPPALLSVPHRCNFLQVAFLERQHHNVQHSRGLQQRMKHALAQ